jgi:Outer membrane protein beta-barrel domain
MKIAGLLLIFAFILAIPTMALAEPFETKHRIYFGPGFHSFWPDDQETDGTKPDQDGIVTDSEWQYIYDDGYDAQEFNGGTFEVGYEYNFVPWFGLAGMIGYYGGTQQFDFTVEGIDVETDFTVGVFHMDVMPRFHWQTRWTDLYGGPSFGIYSARLASELTVSAEFGGERFSFTEDYDESDRAFGWGLDIGFEIRISEHWGIAFEDRVTSAVVFPDADTDNEPFNAGGNVFLIMAVAHL